MRVTHSRGRSDHVPRCQALPHEASRREASCEAHSRQRTTACGHHPREHSLHFVTMATVTTPTHKSSMFLLSAIQPLSALVVFHPNEFFPKRKSR